MIVKIFSKKECPKCPPAKELALELEKRGVNVKQYDVETTDGLAEAAMHDVMATPSVVIVDNSGSEIKSFRGEAPSLEEVIGEN